MMMLIDDLMRGLESQGWKAVGGGTYLKWYTKEGSTIKVMWTTDERCEADQLIKICYSAPAEDKK